MDKLKTNWGVASTSCECPCTPSESTVSELSVFPDFNVCPVATTEIAHELPVNQGRSIEITHELSASLVQ